MKAKLFILFFVLVFIGCGKDTDSHKELSDEDYSDPQKVIEYYISLVKAKEFTKSYQLLSTKSKEYVTENEYLLHVKGHDSTMNDIFDYSNLEPVEKQLDKPSYRRFKGIFTRIHISDTTKSRFYRTLVNENNKWKLCWAETLLQQADQRLREASYDQIENLINIVILIDPFSASAYVTRGYRYYADHTISTEESLKEMLRNFKYIISIEPDIPSSYKCMALYYQKAKQNELRIDQLEKAYTFAISNIEKASIKREISLTYAETNQLRRALTTAKEATDLSPQAPTVWQWLGYVQFLNNEYDSAKVSLEKVPTLGELPSNIKIDYYYSYAGTLYKLGEKEKAKENVLKGLEIEPNHVGLNYLYRMLK